MPVEILTDDSQMPYGTHKGTLMKDVPAKYLVWLKDNNKCSPSVLVYVEKNWDVLCAQAGIKKAVPGTRDLPVKTRWRGR